MVPADGEPPTTPSTDHTAPPLLAVNCWVRVNVSTVTRGVTMNPVPEPDNVMVWGLLRALSTIETLAPRAPVVDGLKVTLMVQAAFAARLAGQLLVWAKSPLLTPVMAMEVMFSAAFPMLLRVTGRAALVVPEV